MPFADMSAARDNEFFCEGMSEEIINALGRVPQLRVASYTSSLRFKGKAADPQAIGRDLRVAWLLEGSVRKSGDTVRIAVQLVRADDGFSAWSGRFDRKLDDIFSVQDDIAGMIAETLTHRVAKVAGPLVTSTTSASEAYSLYLEGRYLWNKRPGDVVWQAIDRFERAISIDPNSRPLTPRLQACAALSAHGNTESCRRRKRWPRQRRPRTVRWNWTRTLRRATPPLATPRSTSTGTRTRPARNSIRPLRSILIGWMHTTGIRMRCAPQGGFAESLDACHQIVELDPLNPLMHAHAAWHHYMAREHILIAQKLSWDHSNVSCASESGISLLIALAGAVSIAEATPQFARRYRVDCSHCHSAPPRLNEQRLRFLAAGYRLDGVSSSTTVPLAIWNTVDVERRHSIDLTKGFPSRVELISAGSVAIPTSCTSPSGAPSVKASEVIDDCWIDQDGSKICL